MNDARLTVNEFDRTRLRIQPLSSRVHDLDLSCIMPLKSSASIAPNLQTLAERIISARTQKRQVILMMGAHVLRSGVQRFLIDMMERGYLTCLAMNGAGVVHDYEFARIGATTESVARYIKDGQFGLWHETGRINEIVSEAAKEHIGLGEAVGRVIERERFPYSDISVLAAGYRLGIPTTVHVGIGCDIVHEFPNCDGGAYGSASYTDFLRFASVMECLEGGVVMNFGSSVMAPEVYLKGLAMARNVAYQQGRQISRFTVLVCDLLNLPANYQEEPLRNNPLYYFRPWKTMLVRTVADGGESYYVRGRHRDTVAELWTALVQITGDRLERVPGSVSEDLNSETREFPFKNQSMSED